MPENGAEMSDSQSATVKNRAVQKVWAFRYPRRFTVLEDFALRILEKQGGASDEEIARILCLDADDIPIILEEFMDAKEVQGDDSRRTLGDSFSRQAVVVSCVAGSRSSDADEAVLNCTSEIAAFLERYGNPGSDRLSPKQKKKWKLEDDSEDICTLDIVYPLSKNADFQCGGESVPEAMHSALSKILPPKK